MDNRDGRVHEGHGGLPSTHGSMPLQAREPAAGGYRESMEALVADSVRSQKDLYAERKDLFE